MKGIYRVYKGGELISESKNLITTAGQQQILQYLAGLNNSWGDYIAAGTGASTPSLTDTSLNFEFVRGPVIAKSVDYTSGQITLKADITDSLAAGWIYELGLFPGNVTYSANSSQAAVLTSFNPNVDAFSVGTYNTTLYRLGLESLGVTAATSTATTTNDPNFVTDVSAYTNADSFALAYFTNDAHCANITVRIKTDSSNYYSYTFTPSTVSGYYITNFSKSVFSATGNPDWSDINQIDLVVTANSGGSTTINFDGLSIISLDPSDNWFLVSRSTLTTPIYKDVNEELNVEYILQFSASSGGSGVTIIDNGDESYAITLLSGLVDNGDESYGITV